MLDNSTAFIPRPFGTATIKHSNVGEGIVFFKIFGGAVWLFHGVPFWLAIKCRVKALQTVHGKPFSPHPQDQTVGLNERPSLVPSPVFHNNSRNCILNFWREEGSLREINWKLTLACTNKVFLVVFRCSTTCKSPSFLPASFWRRWLLCVQAWLLNNELRVTSEVL